jgi:aspartate carbamoyltransferase regulatory subunit
VVKLDLAENIVGMYLEDGSVKCRNCMSQEDSKNLTHKQIITEEDLRKDDVWIYCDYCEKRL